jgi:DNA-binding response OmpR family regulator
MQFRLLAICSTENRDLLHNAFAHWSLKIGWCSTLGEARHALRRRKHPLVLCEAQLPDGSFRDVCELLGRRLKNTRLIILTSNDLETCYSEAIGLGAFDVMLGPCSRTDLQWILMRAIHTILSSANGNSAGVEPMSAA